MKNAKKDCLKGLSKLFRGFVKITFNEVWGVL